MRIVELGNGAGLAPPYNLEIEDLALYQMYASRISKSYNDISRRKIQHNIVIQPAFSHASLGHQNINTLFENVNREV